MSKRHNSHGGSASAGGIGFQAVVTAIAFAHILRGIRMNWLDGLAEDVPVSASAETDGPGDDISLTLRTGEVVEIQVKKGLNLDDRFWSAIRNLAHGLARNTCSFALLIICPDSSGSVRKDMAKAVRRIADGRTDASSEPQKKLDAFLTAEGFNPQNICGRLRIITVDALRDQSSSVYAAKSELRQVCALDSETESAWKILCEEAHSAIELKGRKSLHDLSQALVSAGIRIGRDSVPNPAASLQMLLEWIMKDTETFECLGLPRPLPTDHAWLNLDIQAYENFRTSSTSISDALTAYHNGDSRKGATGSRCISPETLGMFRTKCVVVGGPGAGKSLLMKVIARSYARQGIPSLRLKLRDLAARIKSTGSTLEEALYSLALAGSGLVPADVSNAAPSGLVLLCDGLDECGNWQGRIADDLKAYALSHPDTRIIVTTRPIGYDTGVLGDWRHYSIAPLDPTKTADQVTKIVRAASGLQEGGVASNEAIASYIGTGQAAKLVARSPLLLGFAAALYLRGIAIGESQAALYEQIFKLIDDAPSIRKPDHPSLTRAGRNSILNELGWLISTQPLVDASAMERACAETLSSQNGIPTLTAAAMVEAAVDYWEAAGLVERLNHNGQSVLTFIHKSCAEFAAARHLARLDNVAIADLIRQNIDAPDWAELLDFSTRTSAARIVADVLLPTTPDDPLPVRNIERILHLLSRPDSAIDPDRKHLFFRMIATILNGPDRELAFSAGSALCKAEPENLNEFRKDLVALTASDIGWRRLIGWALLAKHFDYETEVEAIQAAAIEFMEHVQDPEHFMVHRQLTLRTRPDKLLLETLILAVIERLMAQSLFGTQDQMFLSKLVSTEDVHTFSLMIHLERLSKKLGREDILQAIKGKLPSALFRHADIENFHAGMRRLFCDVLPGPFIDGTTQPEPELMDKAHLAAFIQLTGCGEVPLYDARVWIEETEGGEVADLLRRSAQVFGLSLQRLAAASTWFRNKAMNAEPHRILPHTDILPDVDPENVDWARARFIGFDNVALEKLIHHRSIWVAHMAAGILDERIDPGERRLLVQRLLATEASLILELAAALGATMPGNDLSALILKRLQLPLSAGCKHLYAALARTKCPVTSTEFSCLEKGLFSSSAQIALAAADWAKVSPCNEKERLLSLLQSAFEHWLEHEKPYPKNSGIVPDSPRLAILTIINGIAPLTYEQAAGFWTDPRPDVSDFARERIANLAIMDPDIQTRLVSDLCNKRFTPQLYSSVLANAELMNHLDLDNLLCLLEDEDAEYRRLTLQVATPERIGHKSALEKIEARLADKDAAVRDQAYRRLHAIREQNGI